MEIPFQVGVPVTGKNLIDREEILEEMHRSVLSIKKGTRQDFALISPRRMGKTSILLTLKQKLEGEVVCVYLDCSKLYPSTLVNFLQNYSAEVYSGYSKKQGMEAGDRISKAVRGVGTAILDIIQSFGAEFGDIKVWLEFREKKIDESQLMERVLNLPEKLGERDVHFLIILDEFQELEKFGTDFLKYLRGVITSHRRADYIVSGSAVSMMEKIVYDKKSPFYNLFVVKTLNNLPRRDAKEFLRKKFGGFKYKDEAMESILDISMCHPFYLQWLARSVYIAAMTEKKITKEIVENAYHSALKEPSGHFEYEVAKIKDRGRYFDILVVMAKYDLKTPSSAGRELGLKAGEISPYLKRLIEMGFLKKNKGYEFVDEILKEWIKATY
ncbi:MAG: ATP-binding protein [Methanobacteriota archaeon]